MENMNAFCALNIDVIKIKFGQEPAAYSTASIDIYIVLI